MGVQTFASALFGVPFPLSTLQGRMAQQLKTGPSAGLGLQDSGHKGNFGKPIQEGVPLDAVKSEGYTALPHNC